MRYVQTYTDIFLKENIKQGLTSLTHDFDENISLMEKCMKQFEIGLIACKKKNLHNTLILWNYAGFINMCAMELKIHMKSVLNSTNEWETRTHIKTAYLLIHSFYETYDKIQRDYRKLQHHQHIGEAFKKELDTISSEIKEFRKLYLRNVSIIRNNNVAHLIPDITIQIKTMEQFQLSQTIEVLLKFGNILNNIGTTLGGEMGYVSENLSTIK